MHCLPHQLLRCVQHFRAPVVLRKMPSTPLPLQCGPVVEALTFSHFLSSYEQDFSEKYCHSQRLRTIRPGFPDIRENPTAHLGLNL